MSGVNIMESLSREDLREKADRSYGEVAASNAIPLRSSWRISM